MKSTPPAPDYAGAAQQQADSSREVTEQQTWANRPTINTPFGQQTWAVTPVWDPSTGQYLNTWEQNTNLTPEAQSALDSQMNLQQGRSNLAEGLLGRAQEEYGQPMDWSQFEQLADTPDGATYRPEDLQRNLSTSGMQDVDPSQRYYDDASNAIYNQFASRAEPQFTRDTDALRTQLYNQGLREGDEAYDREVQKLRESQGDARQQASYQATIGGGQEAARMHGMDSGTRAQQFGERTASGNFYNQAAQQALNQQVGVGQNNFNQGMQQANYQNTLRQQQIAEAMQQRGFSLNEINAIISGQQVGMPSMPGFNSAQRSEGVQALSAANMQHDADMDAFNAQQQQMQGLMQGGMSAAMMFSDIRLKEDIIFRGMEAGLRWYEYRYIWDSEDVRHIGVMAHEVEHIPGAVVMHPSGYKMVNYGLLISNG
jgi:DNA-binding transcriptional MerR regulator